MDNSKNYLAEFFENIARDDSPGYLVELILGQPNTPDYLLANTKADIEVILTLKDNEQRKRLLKSYNQRLEKTKKYLRKEHIGTPYPEMVVDFLGKFCAWIDDVSRWSISAIENEKIDYKKYAELKNTKNSLDNLWCVIYRAETDYFAEEKKQAEKKMSEAELASTKQNAPLSKRWGIKRITGWIFKKTSHFILTVIVTIFATVIAAIVVDIFVDFGWLQSIKTFIYSIRWSK